MKTTAIVVLATLCWVTTALCQTDTATISGRVTDPSGAAISGADVQVQNVLTGGEVAVKTNSSGVYVVAVLQPGTYRVIVTNPGFKQIVKPDVVLNVQENASLNFSMAVGSISETVTVTGGAPLVNTQDAAVSTVIDRNFVESLPLNGRSFNTLLQLTPGVVIAQLPNTGGTSPGQFSIAGQRTDANNLTVDGVSANFGVGTSTSLGQSGTGSAQAFSALGGTSSLVSVEALQEFRVETSSFAPELGRSPGGQIIITTRSGTNDFHGALYEYFRNDAMDANDWFADANKLAKPEERHNDFGGFLGGPIWKDKTFFFFSYEGARLRLPQTRVVEVPSEYARSIASASVLPFLASFPLPDTRTVVPGVYTAPFTGSFSNKATLDATSIRIDQKVNDKLSIFGRFNNAPSSTVNRVENLSMVQNATVNTTTLTIGGNILLSEHTFDSFRANYSAQTAHLVDSLDTFGGAVPIDLSLLISSLPTSNTWGVAQIFDTGRIDSGPVARNNTKQLNLADEFIKLVGTHELRFGTDYRAIFLHTNPYQHYVEFDASTTESLVLTGSGSLATATNLPTSFLTQSLSVYGQDTWKITPRLTLTYGLRWELDPAPSARGNTTLAAWQNVNDPAAIALAPSGTPIWNTRYDNFAPRAGVVYSLTKKGDLVLRGGGGIFYDLGVGSAADLASFFPNNASAFVPQLSLPLGDVNRYVPAITDIPPFPFVEGFDPHLRLPRSYQWNLALEKLFGGSQVVTVTYVGQAGKRLLRHEAFTQPNVNFTSDFVLVGNSAWSNYNALQLQYRRTFSHNLQALLNYSFSHSLDNSSNDEIAGLSHTVISGASDYASSDFDVRHSLSAALTYTIPSAAKSGVAALVTKGWSVDSVIVARTGFPFNAVVFSTSPDTGGAASSRPDLVPGQPLWVYGSQCLAVDGPPCGGGKGLNAAAFVVPPTVRQGTESRNDIAGFGLTQVDLSLNRKFPITGALSLQFRADAFNVFNHPNFTNPLGFIEFGPTYLQSISMLNQGLGGLNSLFQEGGPRSLQLSLKLSF
jgi:hypothetical protein